MPTMVDVDQYKSALTPQQVDEALQKIADNDIADFLTAQQAQNTYAPKSHASNGTTYGAATGSLYGHVKLSDTADTSGASSGIAATPACVQASAKAAVQDAVAAAGKWTQVAHVTGNTPVSLSTLPADMNTFLWRAKTSSGWATGGMFCRAMLDGSVWQMIEGGYDNSGRYFCTVLNFTSSSVTLSTMSRGGQSVLDDCSFTLYGK